MNIFLKKLSKILFLNFLIVFFFIVLIELFFGYWFDKDNLGPYMREHRMKNQPTIISFENGSYEYNYKRNYYGFRGDDVEPADIKAVILGGSTVDQRYLPAEFTITGHLNENLKNNNYDLKILNGGIEGTTSAGIIYIFKYWFTKLKNFSPEIILFYIGINENSVAPKMDTDRAMHDGLIKNPEIFEFIADNIKSRSLFIDSWRIYKFKYLTRKSFVKYDGVLDPSRENNFKYISYKTAVEIYDIEALKKKYGKKITAYLSRIDTLYEESRKINSNPIFITNIDSRGHAENLFIFNYSLIAHCKVKKYNCIDLAKKLEGKFNYWIDGTHTTKIGSNVIANLIMEDLTKFIKKK